MGVKEDFFRLKQACIQSKGEEKIRAEREMDAFFASLKPEDQEELHAAVTEDFARIHKEAEELEEILTIKKQINNILPIISVSYLAKHYFNKSASWFYQRLNGNKVHGKTCKFTREEVGILNKALQDISQRIGSINIA